jgi:hypothetical protein
VVRHIFQACPVWIYTQSNITSIVSSHAYQRRIIPPKRRVVLVFLVNQIKKCQLTGCCCWVGVVAILRNASG